MHLSLVEFGGQSRRAAFARTVEWKKLNDVERRRLEAIPEANVPFLDGGWMRIENDEEGKSTFETHKIGILAILVEFEDKEDLRAPAEKWKKKMFHFQW